MQLLYLNMFKKIVGYLSFSALLAVFSLIILYTLISFNIFSLKTKVYDIFPNIELRKKVFSKKSTMENFKNDYNVKFLPYTQFEKLNYTKKKILLSKEETTIKSHQDSSIAYKRYDSFFLDIIKDKILLTYHNGNIYFIEKDKIFSNKVNLEVKKIENNLRPLRVFDAFIYEDKIFLSYTIKKNGCNMIKVSFAKIDFNKLEFQNFFNPKICNKTGSPGRIQFYQKDGVKGILVSTSEGVHDKPGVNTQNPSSLFGKILFIPFNKEKNLEIFSTGHRVIQGLNVNEDIIISTEHGPRGGDEINRIIFKENYGWPIVSLGERYNFKYEKKILNYKKDHAKENFKEPLFSFIPSIGISEIVKLPKSFSIYYENHYLVSSLNGKSLYFLRLNKNSQKIISLEKVFVGNRIRDIKVFQGNRSILLALEENGEIGILSNN